MEPVSTSVHHIGPHLPKLPSHEVHNSDSGRLGITKKMDGDGECLKMVQTHGFSGALN